MTKKSHRKVPEPHPITNAGEVGRPFIIAIISIIVIIILAVLLLFSGKFVGKAIHIVDDFPLNKAGISLDQNVIAVGETVTLPIKTDIGNEETVAIGFSINPIGVQCTELSITSSLDWDSNTLALIRDGCLDGRYVFEMGTLNADLAKTGEFEIANVEFIKPESDVTLNLGDFRVYALGTDRNIIASSGVISPTIQSLACATGETTQEGCLQAGICAGAEKTCKDDGDWGGCSVLPLAEICGDGIDNNCDGTVDENCDVVDGVEECGGIICDDLQQCINYLCIAAEGISGEKIILKEIKPRQGIYSTKIEAAEGFPADVIEVTAYTILKDANGKVVVFKKESVTKAQIEAGHIISATYQGSVTIKDVLVQDRLPDQGWLVHGNLKKTYG